MSRWWVGVTMMAGILAQTGPARAEPASSPQPAVPSPYGPARMPPEPLPIGACPPPVPNLIPGPLTPGQAPSGPGPDLDLPASVPGAFQYQNYPTECAFFFGIGAQALQREKLGAGAIAVTDLGITDPQFKRGGDLPTPRNAPVALRFNDITPDMAYGPAGTMGILVGNDIIELTGYYIPTKSKTATSAQVGRNDTFFSNAPTGFAGDFGLFQQDDIVAATLSTEIANVELNYRYVNAAISDCELIMGIRYFDVQEKLNTFVDQNALSHPLNETLGTSNPYTQATYGAETHNRIVAPQLGFEWNHGLLRWLSIGADAKGAWGANFSNVDHSLVRGDGYVGFNNSRTDQVFSQIYEIGAFTEIHLAERVRVKAGYSAMWILHVNSVVDQYEFDLSKPQGPINNNAASCITVRGSNLKCSSNRE